MSSLYRSTNDPTELEVTNLQRCKLPRKLTRPVVQFSRAVRLLNCGGWLTVVHATALGPVHIRHLRALSWRKRLFAFPRGRVTCVRTHFRCGLFRLRSSSGDLSGWLCWKICLIKDQSLKRSNIRTTLYSFIHIWSYPDCLIVWLLATIHRGHFYFNRYFKIYKLLKTIEILKKAKFLWTGKHIFSFPFSSV